MTRHSRSLLRLQTHLSISSCPTTTVPGCDASTARVVRRQAAERRPPVRRQWLALGVLLAVGGLPGAPAVNAQQPIPAAPSGNTTTGRRLTLVEALELATKNSQSLEIAKAGVLRARGQQYQARSAALPQLSASANYQKTLQNQFEALSKKAAPPAGEGGGQTGGDSSFAGNPLTKIFASPYTTTFSITGSQNLYSGGRNHANAEAAKAGRTSAEIGVTSAGAQVTLDVTQAYYDAVLSDNLVAIAEASLLQTERTLRQVQLTQQVGSASEFELIRARVTRDNQRPQFLQARTARDLAYVRLKQLLDVPQVEQLALVDDIAQQDDFRTAPGIAAAAPTSLNVTAAEVTATDPRVIEAVSVVVTASDTSADVRAPVRQATAAVEAAQQQLKATKASRLPSVGLSSTYQRLAYPADGIPRSLGDFFPNWTVGLNVSFPFFTGGRVKGETMAAEAGVIEAQQRLEQVRDGATLDARQSVAQLLEAEETWQASLGTSEQAARAYDIAEVRYREGISTQIELSESRVQLQQSQANRARAARDLQVARIRIKLLRDLPLGGTSGGASAAGAAPAGASGAGSSAGGAASAGTQRPGQTGAPSSLGPPPGGNTL